MTQATSRTVTRLVSKPVACHAKPVQIASATSLDFSSSLTRMLDHVLLALPSIGFVAGVFPVPCGPSRWRNRPRHIAVGLPARGRERRPVVCSSTFFPRFSRSGTTGACRPSAKLERRCYLPDDAIGSAISLASFASAAV